jgi:hypothetical protein
MLSFRGTAICVGSSKRSLELDLLAPTVFESFTDIFISMNPKFFLKSFRFLLILYTKLAESILTPAPIVLETDNFFTKIPFVVGGLALLIASTNAIKLPFN